MSINIGIRINNKPVPLSSGVILLGKEAPRMIRAISMIALSAEEGMVEIPLSDPTMDPHSPLFQSAWAAPYRKGDFERFAQFTRENPAHPFSDLSATQVFWVEERESYTHVLMDEGRRIVGVKALNYAGSVWRQIAEGLADPEAFMRNQVFDHRGLEARAHLQEWLRGRKVFACLHPAPCTPGTGAALWCFDGKTTVSVEKDGEAWELPFFEAVEEEDQRAGAYA